MPRSSEATDSKCPPLDPPRDVLDAFLCTSPPNGPSWWQCPPPASSHDRKVPHPVAPPPQFRSVPRSSLP